MGTIYHAPSFNPKRRTYEENFSVVLALMLAACSSASEYEQNLKKWQAADISHYRFNMFIGCFCPFRDAMPLAIEVKAGEVISIAQAGGTIVTETDPSYPYFIEVGTVERLFEQLGSSLNGGADEVLVTYDATYGFPVTISIDQIKEAIDDEIAYQVANGTKHHKDVLNGSITLDLPADFNSVYIREDHIQQNDIHLGFTDHPETIVPAGSLGNVVAGGSQDLRQELTDNWIIIHYKNAWRRLHVSRLLKPQITVLQHEGKAESHASSQARDPESRIASGN